jgi:hypothetical protein
MTFEEAAKHMEKNKDAVFAELEPWQTSEDCACHQH